MEQTVLCTLENDLIRSVISLLDKDRRWLKVARFLDLFDDDTLALFATKSSPAEKLLNELDVRLCTVDDLLFILNEIKFYDCIEKITKRSLEPMLVKSQPTDDYGSDRIIRPLGTKLILKFDVSGFPLPEFVWTKDNVVISGGETGTLTIESFAKENMGTYICKATQTLGDGTKRSIYSNGLQIVPNDYCQIIDKFPSKIQLKAGHKLKLEVKAEGFPNLEYQWIHNENDILDCTSNIYRALLGVIILEKEFSLVEQ